MKPWSIYILRCSDGSLYTGISTDVRARFARHLSGKGAAYTRAREPVELIWFEEVGTESMARRWEAEIKRWTRTEKLRFLERVCVKRS